MCEPGRILLSLSLGFSLLSYPFSHVARMPLHRWETLLERRASRSRAMSLKHSRQSRQS